MGKHYVCDKHKTKGNTGKCPLCNPDHIADATKKIQPARCPHCGYTPGVIPSDFDAYAQANCEHKEGHAKSVPLPEEDGEICTRLLSACNGHPHALIPWPHRLLHDAVAHISDLTRRLADAEAENGRFAGMLEDSVSGWRKLYTEERAERVRIEGILLNDVQAEHQESDEHIKGLDAVIKTQDKAIRDFKARVRGLAPDLKDAVSALDDGPEEICTPDLYPLASR